MEVVKQGKAKGQYIQIDEILAKVRKIIVWLAFAMDVTTRLWFAGMVSQQRGRILMIASSSTFAGVVNGCQVCWSVRMTLPPIQKVLSSPFGKK
ncbi:hypothetical protein [Dictyobacter arantiisoli]|uniref:hypothetical protein n=1 Tax=Dictyobacter arantiisoli TaxID=2014874 RepID=UPI0011EDFF7A|nr:hypothetical protein [Dictyobacter arantiisoli]